MNRLSRRTFLGGGVATGAALGAGLLRSSGGGPEPDGSGSPEQSAAVAAGSGALVIVQCNGGNDALNTLVPVTGRYHDLRNALAVNDDDLVALDEIDGFGMHPSLAPLASLWDSRRLRWHVGVGFADAGRSHFEAMDAWAAGDGAGSYRGGWVGEWLDDQQSDNPLLAVSFGGACRALFGEKARPTVVADSTSFAFLPLPEAEPVVASLAGLVPSAARDRLGADARQAFLDAHQAVTDFARLGASPGGARGRPTVSTQLQSAAQLLGAGLGTRVVAVMTGGFDTHSNQAATHARLLDELATGVVDFYDTLDQAGLGDQVRLVVTSEFGRRARPNGSGGTDHGKAGTLFSCGAGVGRGVDGDYDLARLDDGDLSPQASVGEFVAAARSVLA